MISVGENFIVTAGYRITAPDLRICKCSANGDQTADDPGCKKDPGGSSGFGSIFGSTENPCADHKANNNHSERKKTQFVLIRHELKIREKGLTLDTADYLENNHRFHRFRRFFSVIMADKF